MIILIAFFRNDQNKVYIFKNEKYEDKTISRFAQFMYLFYNKVIHYKDYNDNVNIKTINELLSESEKEYLNGIDLYTAVHGYKPNAKIICKIVALGDDIKYLSGLRTSGEFQNYKNNTTNMYTTFMFSEVEHLGGYPLITIKAE